jgi:hypothetical protein
VAVTTSLHETSWANTLNHNIMQWDITIMTDT